MSDESYQAPALQKGLEVLEFLSGQTEPYAISELLAASKVAQRDLPDVIVLERLGYLVRTDTDRFAVTASCLTSRCALRPSVTSSQGAPGHGASVRGDFPELPFDGGEWSRHGGRRSRRKSRSARFAVRVGYRRPLNASAAGRFFLPT